MIVLALVGFCYGGGVFVGSLIKKRRKKMRKHKYKKYGKKMKSRK